MNNIIKTTISIPDTIYDENKQLIPSGNYYFHINKFESIYCYGSLKSRGNFGYFKFKSRDVIKMMAIGQSRLIRRCKIKEEDAPNYLSPPTSPVNFNKYGLENYCRDNNCSICLEKIVNPCKLKCNHIFHEDCIVNWFKTNYVRSCPICRSVEPRFGSQVRNTSVKDYLLRRTTLYNNYV